MIKIRGSAAVEKKPTVFFLEDDGMGGIDLMADDGCDTWCVLTIREGKPIKCHSSLPDNFALTVDVGGYVSMEDI